MHRLMLFGDYAASNFVWQISDGSGISLRYSEYCKPRCGAAFRGLNSTLGLIIFSVTQLHPRVGSCSSIYDSTFLT